MKAITFLLSCALLRVSSGAESPVVFDDDFEPSAVQSPPAKWAMWGAQEFKVPANYTRDTNNPHGGEACFRMYHPSNTRGYIVSSPNRAIRPKPKMIYTVSFWASR